MSRSDCHEGTTGLIRGLGLTCLGLQALNLNVPRSLPKTQVSRQSLEPLGGVCVSSGQTRLGAGGGGEGGEWGSLPLAGAPG